MTVYRKSIDADSSTWNGNGSLINFTSGHLRGYGLDKDICRIHPDSTNSPVVFFQWEIDGADGRRLRIKGDGRATITYGSWGTRSDDRVYSNVALPFVLDPAKDGKSTNDGQYYVVAIQNPSAPTSATNVIATATDATASSATSMAAQPIAVDGHTWNGNGSIINFTSGSMTGGSSHECMQAEEG